MSSSTPKNRTQAGPGAVPEAPANPSSRAQPRYEDMRPTFVRPKQGKTSRKAKATLVEDCTGGPLVESIDG